MHADCKGVVEQLAHRHADPKTVSTEPYRFPNIPGFEIVSELGHEARMGVASTGRSKPDWIAQSL